MLKILIYSIAGRGVGAKKEDITHMYTHITMVKLMIVMARIMQPTIVRIIVVLRRIHHAIDHYRMEIHR